MKTKVLLVVTKSNFGGAQRYVFDLANNLPREQFDVSVAFGPAPDGKPGRLAKLLAENGVRTILVPELARDIHAAGDWRAFRALLTLFKNEKPQVVHLNSSKAGGLGAFAARIVGIPRIIFTAHGLPFDEDRSFFSRLLIRIATWATMTLSHTTIAVSNDTLERARRMPFLYRKVVIVHNGILTPSFLSPQDARRELRTIDPGIPENASWVGMIGELHPNKDYITAIEALGFLETDAHLVVIGDGELREPLLVHALKEGVRERVHFLGHVPDAAKYLRAFNVFLLSSQKEGLPYVLLEAGFAYLPVVASDSAGVRDIILDNFTGLLAPIHDAKKFGAHLAHTLNDARLSRSLADELLKRVQKSFSLETMVTKTSVLYQ